MLYTLIYRNIIKFVKYHRAKIYLYNYILAILYDKQYYRNRYARIEYRDISAARNGL